jgi:hypothetical protein
MNDKGLIRQHDLATDEKDKGGLWKVSEPVLKQWKTPVGTWTISTSAWGAYIPSIFTFEGGGLTFMEFTPSASVGKDVKIGFIQTVRRFDPQDNDLTEAKTPAAKVSDADWKNSGAKGLNSFHLDQNKGARVPYVPGPDAHLDDDTQKRNKVLGIAGEVKEGKVISSVFMADYPQYKMPCTAQTKTPLSWQQDFTTNAVVIDGKDQGKPLGCIGWGEIITYDPAKPVADRITVSANQPECSLGASAQYYVTLKAWNEQAEGPADGKTDKEQKPFPLPKDA